jgi:hypothetical protein
MGYWYHCGHSFYNGTRLLLLVLSSFIHGLFPWLFKFHAAHGVMRIYEEREAQIRIAREVEEELSKKEK